MGKERHVSLYFAPCKDSMPFSLPLTVVLFFLSNFISNIDIYCSPGRPGKYNTIFGFRREEVSGCVRV